MYDAFAKEVLNPETTPEGLDEFLSLLLGQKVRVVQALFDDNTRIADENSLLVTDIVVRLEDGSLANLEIQKIGYLFPGQCSACLARICFCVSIRQCAAEKGQYSAIRM